MTTGDWRPSDEFKTLEYYSNASSASDPVVKITHPENVFKLKRDMAKIKQKNWLLKRELKRLHRAHERLVHMPAKPDYSGLWFMFGGLFVCLIGLIVLNATKFSL